MANRIINLKILILITSSLSKCYFFKTALPEAVSKKILGFPFSLVKDFFM